MKLSKWLLVVGILLNQAVFAQVASEMPDADGVVNVTGHGELLADADRASLLIVAKITANSAKEAEAKGYQVGLKLNQVFKQFAIEQTALKQTNNQLYSEILENKQYFVFSLEYSLEFGQFDLIDSLREQAVAAGATAFNISGLLTSHDAEYKAKVRSLAFMDAKQKASGFLTESGFKLGKPLTIDDQASPFPVYAVSRQLATPQAAEIAAKTPLMENRKIRFEQDVRVKFKIID